MNAQLPPSFWQLDQAGPDNDELIVDSFAGGGGASTGIEMALGRSPNYAINHDPEALALHRANHPDTVHLSKNIYKVDPMDVVGRRKVGLLWASPDCKHFSKAKGGKPVKREIRDLAWTVVLWAERVKPRVIILENVEEFQTWGPLVETERGIFPCPDRKGETFKEWIGALKKHGYKVEWRELRACDYGAPTTRKRLFLIARRDGKPIVWPAPTHGSPTDPDVIAGHKKPWRTAAEIIDWSEPCPSIFDTSEEIMAKHGVRAVRPLAENTLARIFKGIRRYVLESASPFIVTCNHGGDWFRGQGMDQPFHTVTAARDAHGLVAPVLAGVGGRAGQSRPRGADEPTATATTKADTVLVTPVIVKNNHGDKPHYPVDEPARTIVAGGTHHTLVAPVLSAAQHGGSLRPADEPHRTIAASDKDQHQVVAAHLMTMRNAGKPFNEADKPTHTVTAGGAGLAMVAASMVQTGYGEREGQEPRALDPEKPLGTVVASGQKHAAVAAFLAQHNNDRKPSGEAYPKPGRPATDPLSTITVTGSQQAVVSAGLMYQKGSAQANADLHGPVPTICASTVHVAEVRAFLMKYYGNEEDGHGLTKPCGTVTTRDRFGLVTVEGVDYQVVDIGMRMLTPRELFKAQGFPDDYRIDAGMFADGEIRPLTKTAQVRMCGNSVCPPIAAALVRANCADLAVQQSEAAA